MTKKKVQKETLETVDINDVLSNGYSEYAKYVIQSRAIPDVRDGMKPVQRRILYSMYRNKLFNSKPYTKSARTVGDVIGTLHPHGDLSVYEAMVRLAQEWKTNEPLIDFHGNKGSIDGDAPAAMRYTESRLGKIVEQYMFTGVDKEGVIPRQDNYDGTIREPVVLPTQFPNVLVNGASGIASGGYATQIAPHNMTEILKAGIHLYENPDATLDDIMQIIPAPDFPTGGVIVNAKTLKKVYAEGKGTIELRAKYEIDTKTDKKKKLIVVTEIPYNVNKSKLIKDMDDIASEKKVSGLLSAYDESSREGLRIVIECSKDANEKVILGHLMNKTDLKKNFNLNMVVIDKQKPRQLGIIEILKSFNEFRVDTRRKELEYDLERLKERVHIVEGYIKLIDILDEVIQVIREARGRKGSMEAIMKEFDFSKEQATAIVDLQLYRISKEDKEKYEEDKKKLDKFIAKLEKILSSKKGVIKNVIKQYEKLIKEFGKDRQTEVVQEEEKWEVSQLDVIKEEDCMVSITSKGYVKRSSLRSYGSSSECGIVAEDDSILEEKATTKNHVLLFTNKANYVYLPVYDLKDLRWGDVGIHLGSMGIALEQDEYVISAYVVTDEMDDKYILTVKTNGQVKRSSVKDHKVVRTNNKYVAIKRNKEELIGAWLVGDEGYVGMIGKDKKAMYFSIDEIAPKGVRTNGMAGIKATEDDYVIEAVFEQYKKDMLKPYVEKKRGQAGAKFK